MGVQIGADDMGTGVGGCDRVQVPGLYPGKVKDGIRTSECCIGSYNEVEGQDV